MCWRTTCTAAPPATAVRSFGVNCGALSESLLESELFGHQRGAFTGAVDAKPGLLEMGDGGSVFLDEIGELPLATQVKLLHALETGEVTRVGSTRSKQVDVRFIAATNRDLAADVQQGRFRKDLYFRINGGRIVIARCASDRRTSSLWRGSSSAASVPRTSFPFPRSAARRSAASTNTPGPATRVS